MMPPVMSAIIIVIVVTVIIVWAIIVVWPIVVIISGIVIAVVVIGSEIPRSITKTETEALCLRIGLAYRQQS
jgi:Flp pilus assembly protein TadB